MIVGSVGAFYMYRARRNATQQTNVPPTESKQPKQSEPVTGNSVNDSPSKESTKTTESKIEKAKPESNNQRTVTSKPEEKSSETSKPKIPEPGRSDTSAHENDRDQNRRNNNSTPPETPANESGRNPRGPGHGSGTDQTPGTTTRPNGSGAEDVCATTSTTRMSSGMSLRNPRKWTRSPRPSRVA